MNLGRHELSIDLDLMTLRWHGVPSLEDIQAAMTRAEGILQSAGSLFVLVDMRDAGPAGTDARRYMQQWLGRHPVCVMALFGVSLPVRVVLLLISRAMVLLGIPSPVYTLFSNEADARAWIEARRRSVQPAPSP